jgi:hypothetical protein
MDARARAEIAAAVLDADKARLAAICRSKNRLGVIVLATCSLTTDIVPNRISNLRTKE